MPALIQHPDKAKYKSCRRKKPFTFYPFHFFFFFFRRLSSCGSSPESSIERHQPLELADIWQHIRPSWYTARKVVKPLPPLLARIGEHQL